MNGDLSQLPDGQLRPGPSTNTRLTQQGTYTVERGTIAVAYPGLQVYQVALAGTLLYAVPLMQSSSTGAGATAPYAAGDHVALLMDVHNAGGLPMIIGSFPVPYEHGRDDRRQLVLPAVSGYRPGEGEDLTDWAVRSTRGKAQAPHYGRNTVSGVVDGDWGVFNRISSGGVAVELFRVWLGGGPMNGLTFWPGQQLARLASVNWQFMTGGQENLDRVIGGFSEEINRRTYLLDEAREERYREISLTGSMHAGRQRFLAPESVVNEQPTPEPEEGELPTPAPARPALFHEYIGVDGSWTVTSAASLTMQKYVGVSIPQEVIDDLEQPYADLQPEDDDGEGDGLPEADQPPDNRIIEPPTGIDSVVLAVQQIEARINHLARTGIDQMDRDWLEQPRDPEVYSETIDARDWRCVPRLFAIESDGRRKIYVGRSVITITDVGHIVLESACGCQIAMAEGSITLQAPKNIVQISGGDCYALAAGQAGIQGRRGVEIIAAEGAVVMNTAQPISMSGPGLNLAGADDNFVITSGGRVGFRGAGIVLEATAGDLLLNAENGLIAWEADGGKGAWGNHIVARLPGGDIVLGGDVSYIPNLTADRLTYHRLKHLMTVDAIEYWTAFQTDRLSDHLLRVKDMRVGEIFDQVAEPEFPEGDFTFAEPPWVTYQRMRACGEECPPGQAPTSWVQGAAAGWRVARVRNRGFIDYQTGTIPLTDDPQLSAVEVVGISYLLPESQ